MNYLSTQRLFRPIVIRAGALADILSTVLLNHIISCSKRHRFLKRANIKTQNKTSCGSSTHFRVCACVRVRVCVFPALFRLPRTNTVNPVLEMPHVEFQICLHPSTSIVSHPAKRRKTFSHLHIYTLPRRSKHTHTS